MSEYESKINSLNGKIEEIQANKIKVEEFLKGEVERLKVEKEQFMR